MRYREITEQSHRLHVNEAADGDAYFAGQQVDATRADVRGRMSRSTLVYMSPSEFLALAKAGENDLKQGNVASVAQQHGAFNSLPYILFDLDDTTARVVDHEGRHRMRWLQAQGVQRVPVEIRCRQVVRQPNPDVYELRWGQTDFRPSEIVGQDGHTRRPMPVSAVFPA